VVQESGTTNRIEVVMNLTQEIMANAPKPFQYQRDWFMAKIKPIRDAHLKSRFEGRIADLITLANNHKAKGVKLGDPVYAKIYSDCITLVDSYCVYSYRTRESILVSAPALNELREWAEYDEEKEMNSKGKIVIACAVGISLAVGVLSGLGVIAYHAMTFWIH